jgi:hypothetical protein
VDNQWRYYDDSSRPLVVHDIKLFMLENNFEPYMLFYNLRRNLGKVKELDKIQV